METKITLTITHKKPISDLLDKVAGRTYTLDGVDDVTASVQAGWLPIESAPKDEIVLLGLPLIGNIREGDRRVYEGRWHEEQSTWTSVNGFLLLGAATHWMLLPPAP